MQTNDEQVPLPNEWTVANKIRYSSSFWQHAFNVLEIGDTLDDARTAFATASTDAERRSLRIDYNIQLLIAPTQVFLIHLGLVGALHVLSVSNGFFLVASIYCLFKAIASWRGGV